MDVHKRLLKDVLQDFVLIVTLLNVKLHLARAQLLLNVWMDYVFNQLQIV